MGLLKTIRTPADLRSIPQEELPRLADEIRERIVEVVAANGGHLASNLGVTELSIALHRVFDFSKDRLLWDVGHQCYPHKLLTGRDPWFHTLRKAGGISGFPSTDESKYDLFNVGHAGTSIPTAVGMARGDASLGRDTRVAAVVGDASIVNGVAFEGLNQAGTLQRQFLVVLNDNEWGIAPTQGAFAQELAKLRVSPVYEEVKQRTRNLLLKTPLVGKPVYEALDHLKERIKATVSPHQIFEQLGFQYIGPIDGHDIDHLIEMLHIVRDVQHPILLHVHTHKGRGCEWATADPGRFHSPKPFCLENGKVTDRTSSGRSWTRAFVDNLIELARDDDRIFALTAAMPDGTGLNRFAEQYPDRCLDAGIAESCTVDIAAGMAKSGLRPVVAIYSTFLQRAFDQVFQEVALQGLPVVFCIDRAGLVGGDGAVHHGFLDIAYLRGLPGMTLMAPADEPELLAALKLALSLDKPCAIRYPRDSIPAPLGTKCPPFEVGVSRELRAGGDATILAYGTTTSAAVAAAETLSAEGIEARVINARFARPVDRAMVAEVFADDKPVVTLEDHSIAGGFGGAVLETVQELSLAASRLWRLGIPADRFVPHGPRDDQLAKAGLDAAGVAAVVRRLLHGATARRQAVSEQSRPAERILRP